MTHPGHGRTECSCGTVISQCRCVDKHKVVRVLPGGCAACVSLKAQGRIPFGQSSSTGLVAGDQLPSTVVVRREELPSTVLLLHPDGRLEARSFDGKMVEIPVPFERLDRLRDPNLIGTVEVLAGLVVKAREDLDLVGKTMGDALTDACTLLRRAALMVAAYESGETFEEANDDLKLLEDIGAFLARVGQT